MIELLLENDIQDAQVRLSRRRSKKVFRWKGLKIEALTYFFFQSNTNQMTHVTK